MTGQAWVVTVDGSGLFERIRFGPFAGPRGVLDAICFAAGLQLPDFPRVKVRQATPWVLGWYVKAEPSCEVLLRVVAKHRLANGTVKRVRVGKFSTN